MKVVLLEVSLMKFIVRISKEIKWKVKVVSLELSLMNFILQNIQRDHMEGDSGVTRSIIDDIQSSDIQRDQMEGENGVN